MAISVLTLEFGNNGLYPNFIIIMNPVQLFKNPELPCAQSAPNKALCYQMDSNGINIL